MSMVASLWNGTTIQIPSSVNTVVGTANKPTRLYMFHSISGASASAVLLYNAATATNQYLGLSGTANTGKTFTFGVDGFFFPNGLTIFANSNTTSCLITYSQ